MNKSTVRGKVLAFFFYCSYFIIIKKFYKNALDAVKIVRENSLESSIYFTAFKCSIFL